MDDKIKEELKLCFKKRLEILCRETREKTGEFPSRLQNILNGTYGEWFSGIENLVEDEEISGINYLYNDRTGENHFNLTIEAIVVENRDYRGLFSETAIETCKKKLKELKYEIELP